MSVFLDEIVKTLESVMGRGQKDIAFLLNPYHLLSAVVFRQLYYCSVLISISKSLKTIIYTNLLPP